MTSTALAAIASSHSLATEAGVQTITRDGNVLDAAVAVSLETMVTEHDNQPSNERTMLTIAQFVGRDGVPNLTQRQILGVQVPQPLSAGIARIGGSEATAAVC